MSYLTRSRFLNGIECEKQLEYDIKNMETVFDEDPFMVYLRKGTYQFKGLLKEYYRRHYQSNFIDLTQKDLSETLSQTERVIGHEDNIVLAGASVKHYGATASIDFMTKKNGEVTISHFSSKSVSSSDERITYKNNDRKPLSNWKKTIVGMAYVYNIVRMKYPQISIKIEMINPDTSKVASVDHLNSMFIVRKHPDGTITTEMDDEDRSIGKPIFSMRDVTELVKNVSDDMQIQEKITGLLGMMKDKDYPPHPIGEQCKSCIFDTGDIDSGFTKCWSSATEYDAEEIVRRDMIFDLRRGRSFKKFIDDDIIFLDQIPEDSFFNNGEYKNKTAISQHQQVRGAKKQDRSASAQEVEDGLEETITSFEYPLHFIDFESSRSPLPFFRGMSPYEMITFQFSIHTLYEDGTVEQFGWINKRRGKYPNIDFIRELLSYLDELGGTPFCYSYYEISTLNALRDQIENFHQNIEDRKYLMEGIDNLSGDFVDLLKIVKNYYYHPLMKGSNSIKYVFPTIVEINPELAKRYKIDIKEMYNDIDNGATAVSIYELIQHMDKTDELDELYDQLEEYCKTDTLAMLIIFEHFRDLF